MRGRNYKYLIRFHKKNTSLPQYDFLGSFIFEVRCASSAKFHLMNIE